MDRGEILRTAESHINGDRKALYGDHRVLYTSVAHLWRGYVMAKYRIDVPFDYVAVLDMMAEMKKGRRIHNPDHSDNVVDETAYIALAGEG